MAQRYQTPDGKIYEEQPGGGYVEVTSQPQQPYTIGTPDPSKAFAAPREQAGLTGDQLGNQKTAQQIALEAARVPYAPRQAAADTSKAEAEAAAAALALQKAQREAALPVSGQVGRVNLQRAIDDIKAKFAAGPGRTSGIAGLADYLPTTENQQFDAAGNSVRGFVGPALGLTGGQLNTEKEAQRAVGPYIPQSNDRDAVIQDKIRRLQGLADAMGGARRQGQQQSGQTQGAMIPGAASQTPSGPEGYNVGTTGGGVSGGSGGGSTFASAAGVAMAKKLSQAYTKGAGVQELNRLLADNGFQTFTDLATIAAIQKKGRLNFAPPVADDTRGGVGKALGALADSAGGAYAINAADALTAGTLDNIAGGQSNLAIDYSQQQYPGASLAGTVTGGALAAGGAELGLARAGLGAGAAALGGDALYGAAYGAGSADDGSRVLGALGGGVGGLAGGAAGRGLARGAGGLLRGVRNADVQGLRAAGVPLTVGQTLGGAAKGIEDRLSGVPVIGGVVNARRLEGMQGFNRAAFDEALAPIGANTGGITGEAGIDAAQGATRQGYDNALNGVSVTRDPQFTGDYNGAIAQGSQVPRVGPEFEAWARSDLDPLTAQPQYDGATIQDFIQQTRGADFGNDAMGNLVGRSVTGAEDAMRGLVSRQAPDVLPALRNADQASRNGTRVGETGTFAPSQLADASAANAKKFGNSQGTTRQPFFGLSRAGQAVLPNSVPDSGTAGRLLTQQALGAAGLGVLGGGAGYAGGGEDGAQALGLGGLATGGLLAAGGSRVAQRALVASLLDRYPAMIAAGNGIASRARIGGLFGAPMLAGAGSQLATQ
jgi:hypothetical protein